MRTILFVIFLLTMQAAFCQSTEELYKKASDEYDKEQFTNAVASINRALEKDSVNADYLLLKGNALRKLKRIQESFDAYSLAINYHPLNSICYCQRGLLLTSVQETDYAIKDFTTALGFEKKDTIRLTLFLNRGAAKINIRDFNGAYDDFIEALKYDSLNIGTLNNLATVCDEVGKGDQTLGYLFKIIKIDSTFIGAYVNIGFKYQVNGKYNESIKYFNKVLQLDPNEPLTYNNRAYSLYKLGKLDKALEDVNKSISLYNTNSYAFRNRALIFIAQKKNDKACADINEALELGFTKMYGDEIEILKKQYCK